MAPTLSTLNVVKLGEVLNALDERMDETKKAMFVKNEFNKVGWGGLEIEPYLGSWTSSAEDIPYFCTIRVSHPRKLYNLPFHLDVLSKKIYVSTK